MDPYLEAPSRWPDVHHELISQMRGLLTEKLRPRYHVRVEERVYVSDSDDPGRAVLVPDLHVGRSRAGASAKQVPPVASGSSTPVLMTTVLEEEIHEARLEIRDSTGGRVITVVELLSPSNKVLGSRHATTSFMHRRPAGVLKVSFGRSHCVTGCQ
jgi:hypothetical protein